MKKQREQKNEFVIRNHISFIYQPWTSGRASWSGMAGYVSGIKRELSVTGLKTPEIIKVAV